MKHLSDYLEPEQVHAMLAAARGTVDPDLALLESLDCCLRAGADMIITYFARRATQLIDRIT
jgi:delta-aminolevulinic acid dehydratase/porphobilinogen synthase